MRTRTTLTATALAAAALLLTACQNGAPSSGSKPSASSTSSPASTTPSSAPSGDQTTRTIGDTFSNSSDADGMHAETSVTVIGYEHGFNAQASAATETGERGYVWSALHIKLCALSGSDTVVVSRTPWVLAYSDGARIEASGTTYGDFPKPEYPIEGKVKGGDCVRGKIAYAVPGKERPTKVIYAPGSLDEPVEWTFPTG
ncbi:hypothetical protein ACVNF4_06520 [Streptomyces sp. S6]